MSATDLTPPAVIIVAGQSNALGYHLDAGDLPPKLKIADPMVRIWTGMAFEVMRPGVNTGTPANPNAWGPESEFAWRWRADHPSQPLYVIKSVKGSAGLAADPHALDWSPRSRGELFDRATATVWAARKALTRRDEVRIVAILWEQGEEDATSRAKAVAYRANAAQAFARMRRAWAAPNTPILFGRVSTGQHLPFGAVVQRGQRAADRMDPYAVSVDTDGFGLQADRLHFSGAGQVALGDALYDARP